MTGISWPMVAFVLCLMGVLFLAQPLILGLSASMAGEKSPSWFKGMLTLILAGFSSTAAGLIYSFTLGLVLARFGAIPQAIGALGVSLLATSIVYSALLRIAIDRAFLVAGIYWAISGAIGTTLYALLTWWIG